MDPCGLAPAGGVEPAYDAVEVYEVGASASDETAARGVSNGMSALLSDATLSVEDKVAMVMSMIAMALNEDIEEQLAKLERIQSGEEAGDLEVETMKLDRLVTKREQFVETFKSVIAKYDETARSVIRDLA
jgi:hypothetical protein